jgi:putative membrane protein
MSTVFLIIGAIFVGIAGLIHVFIFLLESVLWNRPSTWKRFGVKSQGEADVLRPMAYNQGFYNVFLALGAGAGLVMLASSTVQQAGAALSIFVLLSMLLASIVLLFSNPKLGRAAALQGAAPLIGLIFLIIAITTAS